MEWEHEYILVVEFFLLSEVMAKLSNTSVDGIQPRPSFVIVKLQLPPVLFLIDVGIIELAEMERELVNNV